MKRSGLVILLTIPAILCGLSGCTKSSVTTPDGETVVYLLDKTDPTGPDTATVSVPQPKKAAPADQPKAVAPKAAAPKVAPPLASADDIRAAKERIAALKGSVKMAPNGAIISVKLSAGSGEGSDTGLSLDDMKLIGRLADIESVSFEGAAFGDEQIAALANLKKLSSVTINNAEIGDAALETLATLPELTFLDIRRDLKLNNASLEILTKMPKLTELHALYNSFTNSGMAKISKTPTLKIVDVRGCADVSDNGAKYLARLPELEEVYFRFMITNTGVENLTAAPKLRFIEFQDCNDINEGAVESFKKMPSLQGLRIFRCKGFNDAALQGIAALPLVRLELRDLNVSNAGIAALKSNTSLKAMELSELASVDAAGLNDLLAAVKGLEKIDFFAIPLDNEGLSLVVANNPELKNLTLRAVAVSDAGIDSILKLTKLETLDLRENSGLSADAIAKLANLKNLKTLYIKETGITAKGAEEKLAALKKALPKCRIEI